MPNLPIPDDWNGVDTELWLICAPASPKWRLALVTAVKAIVRGRYWDETTGNILATQQTAIEVYESMTTCDDLITQLGNIAAAINAQAQTLAVSVSCCDTVTPPVPTDPPPDPPPPGGGGTWPPAYTTQNEYDTELCRFANAIHWQVHKWLDFLSNLDFYAAVIAILVSLAAIIFPEPATTAIGATTLASILGVMLLVQGGLDAVAAWAEGAVTFWDAIQTSFVCTIYNMTGSVQEWKDNVAQAVFDEMSAYGTALPAGLNMEQVFLWLGRFLDWAQVDLYEFGQNLPDHPTPIDCTCVPPADWITTFDADGQGWHNSGIVDRREWVSAPDGGNMRLNPNQDFSAAIGFKSSDLVSLYGVPAQPLDMVKVEFLLWKEAGPSENRAVTFFAYLQAGGTVQLELSYDDLPVGTSKDDATLYTLDVNDLVLHPGDGTWVFQFVCLDTNLTVAQHVHIDDIAVYLNP